MSLSQYNLFHTANGSGIFFVLTFKLRTLIMVTQAMRSSWKCQKEVHHLLHKKTNQHIKASSKTIVSLELFWERLSEKLCMRQSRRVIWDMINTLFLYFCCFPLVLTNLRLWSRVILSNFIEELVIQYYPQYLSALSRALFLTTFLEIAVCSGCKENHFYSLLFGHWSWS